MLARNSRDRAHAEMAKPRVLPIRENRKAALDYWIRFCRSPGVLAHRSQMMSKDRAELLGNRAHDGIVATIDASRLGGYLLANAADQLVAADKSGWQQTAEALAVGYLGSELMRHLRERSPQLYCRQNNHDLYYIAFHAVLAGLRLWPEADCLGRHLMNFWLARGVDNGLREQDDYLGFYGYLMRAQYRGEWPAPAELDPSELGDFYPLFETAGKPQKFRSALVEYCDFRLARMHEYPSQRATRRYPEPHTDALTYGPLLLLPAELLAFKAIYERVSGDRCDLQGEHPLLENIAFDPPEGLGLPENDLTAATEETGKAVYGADWRPGALVEVRFDDPPTLPP